MEITVACFQSDVLFGDEHKNRQKALNAIDHIFSHIEKKIHFISFPELFTTGFDYDYLNSLSLADIDSSYKKTISLFSEKAIKYNVYIQLGTLPEPMGGKIYNSASLINPQGNLLGSYHKNHLFPLMNEDKFFTPGEDIKVFSCDSLRVGIAICFDIRFASLFNKLAILGAEIVFVPAQFPAVRINHWDILLRARAIENQYIVIGNNRIGKDPQNNYPGHSVILDPLGKNLTENRLPMLDHWVIGSFDTTVIKRIREDLPAFSYFSQ